MTATITSTTVKTTYTTEIFVDSNILFNQVYCFLDSVFKLLGGLKLFNEFWLQCVYDYWLLITVRLWLLIIDYSMFMIIVYGLRLVVIIDYIVFMIIDYIVFSDYWLSKIETN